MLPKRTVADPSKQAAYNKRYDNWTTQWNAINGNPKLSKQGIYNPDAQKALTLLAKYAGLETPFSSFLKHPNRKYTAEVHSAINRYFNLTATKSGASVSVNEILGELNSIKKLTNFVDHGDLRALLDVICYKTSTNFDTIVNNQEEALLGDYPLKFIPTTY